MALIIEEFIKVPSEIQLNELTKDQLVELASHYEIDLLSQDKCLKYKVKEIIKIELIKRSIL